MCSLGIYKKITQIFQLKKLKQGFQANNIRTVGRP